MLSNEITRTPRKRPQDNNKENEAALPETLPPEKKRQVYAERISSEEKLLDILKTIDDANWSMSDFLYYTFRNKD